MHSDLRVQKAEDGSLLFNEVLDYHLECSIITETNKPWHHIISNKVFEKYMPIVNAPYGSINGSEYVCRMDMLRVKRKFDLLHNFYEIDNEQLFHLLLEELKEKFTHLYSVLEIRGKGDLPNTVSNTIFYTGRGIHRKL